eukprot:CAMPEP_0174385114 /NCGR_PEP_ID=MMETSP0811_2-20130205/126374_1 /TAXON_ID=73025 ORGANISM="Eutreptiella gymnastica-like, Strain CCMP1594" /NCGR_SAMPLE_ID=MMETSP0811_2 /ASSEMBLY_ACC=CAM_ASM_000667 /LENGTH=195 /DNA_ID=CAMNT_0015539307 /DNA_START=20 /DNA_END=608 /DNA_ORIENTATION=-
MKRTLNSCSRLPGAAFTTAQGNLDAEVLRLPRESIAELQAKTWAVVTEQQLENFYKNATLEMETGELLHGPVKVYSCSMGLWVAKELSDRKEVVIRVLRSEEEARAFVAFRERENEEVWERCCGGRNLMNAYLPFVWNQAAAEDRLADDHGSRAALSWGTCGAWLPFAVLHWVHMACKVGGLSDGDILQAHPSTA